MFEGLELISGSVYSAMLSDQHAAHVSLGDGYVSMLVHPPTSNRASGLLNTSLRRFEKVPQKQPVVCWTNYVLLLATKLSLRSPAVPSRLLATIRKGEVLIHPNVYSHLQYTPRQRLRLQKTRMIARGRIRDSLSN